MMLAVKTGRWQNIQKAQFCVQMCQRKYVWMRSDMQYALRSSACGAQFHLALPACRYVDVLWNFTDYIQSDMKTCRHHAPRKRHRSTHAEYYALLPYSVQSIFWSSQHCQRWVPFGRASACQRKRDTHNDVTNIPAACRRAVVSNKNSKHAMVEKLRDMCASLYGWQTLLVTENAKQRYMWTVLFIRICSMCKRTHSSPWTRMHIFTNSRTKPTQQRNNISPSLLVNCASATSIAPTPNLPWTSLEHAAARD